MPDEDKENILERLSTLEQQMREHFHGGSNTGASINFANLIGTIPVVTSSAKLTAILAGAPRNIPSQIFIDTTTATKKLYVYDSVGNVWRSCTIA